MLGSDASERLQVGEGQVGGGGSEVPAGHVGLSWLETQGELAR